LEPPYEDEGVTRFLRFQIISSAEVCEKADFCWGVFCWVLV
jgi:hypothetical protein